MKIFKIYKGFTLMELVIVIMIIMILALVVFTKVNNHSVSTSNAVETPVVR
jgi:Tfp pilus assembly protein PilE